MTYSGHTPSPPPDFELLDTVLEWRYAGDQAALTRDVDALQRFVDTGRATSVGSCVFLEHNHRLMRLAQDHPERLRGCLIDGEDTYVSAESLAFAAVLDHASLEGTSRVTTSFVEQSSFVNTEASRSTITHCPDVAESKLSSSEVAYSVMDHAQVSGSMVLRCELVGDPAGMTIYENVAVIDNQAVVTPNIAAEIVTAA